VSRAALQPRLATFLVMRATAVVLAVLVLGHFAVTHLVTDVAATDSSFVLRRWSSALWLSWDWTMLAATLAHAGCGLWLVIDELASTVRARRVLHGSVVVASAVLLAVGTTAIAIVATR
jgi:succinate dehydrogenase / fumarate reductase membrane anchor subunit